MMPRGPRHKSIGLLSILTLPRGIGEAFSETNLRDLVCNFYCLGGAVSLMCRFSSIHETDPSYL